MKKVVKDVERVVSAIEPSTDLSNTKKASWLVNAHLSMAQEVSREDLGKAKKHLIRAKEIIEKNPLAAFA